MNAFMMEENNILQIYTVYYWIYQLFYKKLIQIKLSIIIFLQDILYIYFLNLYYFFSLHGTIGYQTWNKNNESDSNN